jgi:hypothetical protein
MSTLLEQASLVLIPSGYKEDIVYSQIPTNGNGDLSFTRASNGTRVNSAGLVEVCPWNLVQYSNTFSNAAWLKSSCTLTSGQNDPNGGTNGWRYLSSVASSGYCYQGGVLQNGVQYTFYIYAKSNTGSNQTMYFTANSGTVTSPAFTLTSTWQLCSWTFTANATGDNIFFGYNPSATLDLLVYGAQLNIGSTAKPYFPTTDRLNVPRLTYQNGGGGCPSLLLEKQSTNLALYSEQFDNAYWAKTNATISANNTTSPDGTQNADLIIADTTNGVHQFRTTVSSVTAQNYTMSIFAKKSGINFIRFWEDGQTGKQCYFNLNTGVATNVDMTSVSIENIGNGWYRCIAIVPIPASGVFGFRVLVSQDGSATAYAGNGTSGIFIWGAQLEASSYPTSYIPTTSASATRVADACFKTGISSLIGQTEGVLFMDFVAQPTPTAQSHFWIGVAGNEIGLYGNSQFIFYSSGGVSINGGNFVAGTRYKVAFAYKANDYVAYINGTQVGTDTSATVPTTSALYINSYSDFTEIQNKQVNEFVLFPTRLTNAELASLTTI